MALAVDVGGGVVKVSVIGWRGRSKRIFLCMNETENL